LMEFIKGPDFPTGGQIFNIENIKQAFATGKGPITMRGKAEIVETKSGMFRIIITEVPYQVNKANLVEKIANLVKDKKIEGIKDLRDESDKDGVRVVVELKKDTYPKKINCLGTDITINKFERNDKGLNIEIEVNDSNFSYFGDVNLDGSYCAEEGYSENNTHEFVFNIKEKDTIN